MHQWLHCTRIFFVEVEGLKILFVVDVAPRLTPSWLVLGKTYIMRQFGLCISPGKKFSRHFELKYKCISL